MKKSVWVIDDDEVYQMIIKKLIKIAGGFKNAHYFMSAPEVIEGLLSSNLFLPDVILLDINMPQMDGWQFLNGLKENIPDLINKTSIYIVSSSIAYSDRERANEFPEVIDFLSKPVSVKQLQEISKVINKKSPA